MVARVGQERPGQLGYARELVVPEPMQGELETDVRGRRVIDPGKRLQGVLKERARIERPAAPSFGVCEPGYHSGAAGRLIGGNEGERLLQGGK